MTTNSVGSVVADAAAALEQTLGQAAEEMLQFMSLLRNSKVAKKDEFLHAVAVQEGLWGKIALLHASGRELVGLLEQAKQLDTDAWAKAAEDAIDRLLTASAGAPSEVLEESGEFYVDPAQLEAVPPEEKPFFLVEENP